MPIAGQLYLDRNELQGIVQGFTNEDHQYLCLQIPNINGDRRLQTTGGGYGGFYWIEDEAANYAQAGKTDSIGFGQDYPEAPPIEFEHKSFFTKKYAQQAPLPKEYLNVQPVDQLEGVGATLLQLKGKVLGAAERAIAANLTDTSIWTQNTTLTYDWTDPNGTPLEDIRAAVKAVGQNGVPADTIIFGYDAWNALIYNQTFNNPLPVLIDRAAMYNGNLQDPLQPLRDALKLRFGLRNVFFADARWNSSPTEATKTIDNVFGDNTWVGHMGGFGRLDARNVNGAWALSPRAFLKASAGPYEIEQVPDMGRYRYGVSYHQAFEVVNPKLGYLIKNCA